MSALFDAVFWKRVEWKAVVCTGWSIECQPILVMNKISYDGVKDIVVQGQIRHH